MKTSFFSLALLLFLLLAHDGVHAAVPCSTVAGKAAACVGYATGKAPRPVPACCSGLRQLVGMLKSVDDKKNICQCLKTSGKNLGIQDKYLSQIPTLCNIKLGFPISTSTKCEAIH
ncbi:hypothetical protein NMG60_11005192 [Bertholletia excelsa]